MALFSFSDIKFTSTSRKISARSRLTPQSEYRSSISRYPIDIGDADKGHYMVIHVNEQLQTQFKGAEGPDDPTIFTSRRDSGTTTGAGRAAAAVASAGSGTIAESSFSPEQIKLNFTRTIRRTKDTIALYMPDTLNFAHEQSYSGLQLGATMESALLESGFSLYDDYQKNGLSKDLLKNLSPFVAQIAQSQDLFKAGFAAYTGRVVNPLLDMVYSSPDFRKFRFDFMFYPRSEREAKEVNAIIRKLNFYQAPEFITSGEGFFLIPPAEFDIKFYYNGVENMNIPKISTCVLTNIDVDYAPNGWSAYETYDLVPTDGGTGMPVAIRMSLQFTETEILTKNVLPDGSDVNTIINGF